MKPIHSILLSLFMVQFSCEDGNSEIIFDENELIAILDADDAAGLDGFDDEGLADLDFEFGLETGGTARVMGDTLSYGEGYRIRFGRQINDIDRTIEFTVNGDTAIGFVTYTITGVFMVQAIDTSNHESIDSMSFTKDFNVMFTRLVRYVNVEHTGNPDGHHWEIDALTPLIGGAGDKVSITTIDIYSFNGSAEVDLLYSFASDGIGDLFIDRESLPTFTAFEPVLVRMTVENGGPEYAIDSTGVGEWCMLRYARNGQHRGRRHLNDTGRFFDTVVNDNVHTGSWRVHGPGVEQVRRVFRSFFDVVDLATLFVEEGGFNTAVWSIPYIVERP